MFDGLKTLTQRQADLFKTTVNDCSRLTSDVLASTSFDDKTTKQADATQYIHPVITDPGAVVEEVDIVRQEVAQVEPEPTVIAAPDRAEDGSIGVKAGRRPTAVLNGNCSSQGRRVAAPKHFSRSSLQDTVGCTRSEAFA